MENEMNRKISRLFPTSFVSSCKFTTVIQNSIVSHKPKRPSSSSPTTSNPTLFSSSESETEDSKHTTAAYYPGSQEKESQKPSSCNGIRGSAGGRAGEKGYVNVVAKRSGDPYRDFRESMVEMIVEKKIRGAEDLEKLVQTFLGLNHAYHHQVILNAFHDICQALFSLES